MFVVKTHLALRPFVLLQRDFPVDQGFPTFLLVQSTFTGENLLRATGIFTKIKLQIIASLLYKIGTHFGQYFGYLSKNYVKTKKKSLPRKSVLISVSILQESVLKSRWEPKENKTLCRKFSIWF